MTARPPEPRASAVMVDIKYVAALGGCSTRHIRRLNDAGLMPAPIRLGHLLRWRKWEIEEWFVAGCPAPKAPGARSGKTGASERAE